MRNSARKQVRNTVVRTQVKTAVKKFRAAVESSLDTSPEVLRVAISTLDKAVKKGVIKPGESVVVCVTGNGYKTAEVLDGRLEEPVQLSRSFKDFEAWQASRTEQLVNS